MRDDDVMSTSTREFFLPKISINHNRRSIVALLFSSSLNHKSIGWFGIKTLQPPIVEIHYFSPDIVLNLKADGVCMCVRERRISKG